MKIRYVVWFVNGIIFPVVAMMFLNNHNPISAFEPEYAPMKDVLFYAVLAEHVLATILTCRRITTLREPMAKNLLLAGCAWLAGVVALVIAAILFG